VIVSVSGRNVVPKIVSLVRQMNSEVKILARVHYLQQVADIPTIDYCDIVVAETESAKAICQRALDCYGL
jgi:hypothetical protein